MCGVESGEYPGESGVECAEWRMEIECVESGVDSEE